MFFTQEDFIKIQTWLQQNAIKDTEFKTGLASLKGDETIVIVQNGCNVKLYLKDFIEQLMLLGLPDFVNITVKFHKKNITLEEAISLIPCLSREIGQVITFINEDGEWKIYQFQGDTITEWNDTSLWADLLKQMAGGTVDYKKLTNKPSIGGVTLEDNKTLEDLGIQPAGDYVTEDTSFDGRGTTEQRPSGLMMSNAGYRYYDSTIEQTIVWNGEDWCNEDMTLLSKVVII